MGMKELRRVKAFNRGLIAGMMLNIVWCVGCWNSTPTTPPTNLPPVPTTPPVVSTPPVVVPPPIATSPDKTPVTQTPADPPSTTQPTTPPDKPVVPLLPEKSKWKVVHRLKHEQRVTALSFSTDDLTLAVANGDPSTKQPPSIQLWTTSDGTSQGELLGHSESITGLAFGLDGKTLVSSGGKLSQAAEVKIWDAVQRKEQSSIPVKGLVGTLALNATGDMLATGGNLRTVDLWEFPSGKKFASWPGHTDFLTALAFSPDGQLVASGSADKTIRLWNLPDGSERTTLRGHGYFITAIAFSPNGDLLATAAADNVAILWETKNYTQRGQILTNRSDMQTFCMSFSPDSRRLAIGYDDHSVRIWEPLERKELQILIEHTDYVTCLSYSHDGKLLAAGSEDGSVVVWSVP